VVKALYTGNGFFGFKTQQGMGTRLFSELEKMRKRRHPTSVTPLPVQAGSLTATYLHDHWLRDNLYPISEQYARYAQSGA